MKKKILFAIVLLCLALTACGKDEHLESLEVTEAETKSIFDVSEDFEKFTETQGIEKIEISTPSDVQKIEAELETVSNINIQEKLTEEQAQYIDVLLSSNPSKSDLEKALNDKIFNTLSLEEKEEFKLQMEQERQLADDELVDDVDEELLESLLDESNKKMQEDALNGELATFD